MFWARTLKEWKQMVGKIWRLNLNSSYTRSSIIKPNYTRTTDNDSLTDIEYYKMGS